jgi:hypothetical protein
MHKCHNPFQFLIYPGIAARRGEELLEEISKIWLKIKSLKMAMDKNRVTARPQTLHRPTAKKRENNQKNGNRYLAWAYVEAANHAIRCCPKAQKFFQRKMAKSERVLATKALANKLTKATYYIMRDQVDFDEDLLFR